MSLELVVSAEDVKSLLTEERNLVLGAIRTKRIPSAERVRGRRSSNPPDYSITFWANPMTHAYTLLSHPAEQTTRAALGEDYEAFSKAIDFFTNTGHRIAAFVQYGAGPLDAIAALHVYELEQLVKAYNRLSGQDVTAPPRRGISVLQTGLDGICKAIIFANAMYNPSTRKEFLAHVKRGELQKRYARKLLGSHPAYTAAHAAKTL